MNSDFALALHCLLLLAFKLDQPVTSAQIAKSASVHPVRVRKILGELKRAGFIDSKEGAKGGFYLKRKTCETSLGEVYQLFSANVLRPKVHSCDDSCMIGAHIEEVLVDIFDLANANLNDFLNQYKLTDVLKELCSCKDNNTTIENASKS